MQRGTARVAGVDSSPRAGDQRSSKTVSPSAYANGFCSAQGCTSNAPRGPDYRRPRTEDVANGSEIPHLWLYRTVKSHFRGLIPDFEPLDG
jgi:hypothetical protein